jgi:hypothetical protein
MQERIYRTQFECANVYIKGKVDYLKSATVDMNNPFPAGIFEWIPTYHDPSASYALDRGFATDCHVLLAEADLFKST